MQNAWDENMGETLNADDDRLHERVARFLFHECASSFEAILSASDRKGHYSIPIKYVETAEFFSYYQLSWFTLLVDGQPF